MKSFFYMQRNDRRAIMAVLVVIAVVAGIMIYIGDGGGLPPDAPADSTAINAAGGDARGGGTQDGGYYAAEGRKAELFAFDPNIADSTQLLRLGLAPWQVRNIYRYRAKGGIYRDKTDFARLYGLTAGRKPRGVDAKKKINPPTTAPICGKTLLNEPPRNQQCRQATIRLPDNTM